MVKKIIGLMMGMLLLFLLVACNTSKEDGMGNFYSLKEAYDKGILTQNDLKNIAYYLNDNSDDDTFIPNPLSPVYLSVEVEKSIKLTAVYELRTRDENSKPEATIEDITILGYYGTYNDYIVVRLSDSFSDYPDVVYEIVIDDVTFIYSGASITIWHYDK